jgi:hypothetical protein
VVNIRPMFKFIVPSISSIVFKDLFDHLVQEMRVKKLFQEDIKKQLVCLKLGLKVVT